MALALAPLIMIDHRHGAQQQEVVGQPSFSGREGRLDLRLRPRAASGYSTRSSFWQEQRGDDNVIIRAPAVAFGVRLLAAVLPAPDAHPVEQRPPLSFVEQLLEDLLDVERVVNDDPVSILVHRQFLPRILYALAAQGGIQYGEGHDPRGGAAPRQGLVEPPGAADDLEEQPLLCAAGLGRPSKKTKPAIVIKVVPEILVMLEIGRRLVLAGPSLAPGHLLRRLRFGLGDARERQGRLDGELIAFHEHPVCV